MISLMLLTMGVADIYSQYFITEYAKNSIVAMDKATSHIGMESDNLFLFVRSPCQDIEIERS